LKHFVYITTNLINGKRYIGDHSTNNLGDNYLGSGKALIRSIKKNGKEYFSREIIEIFETKQEAFDAQEKYIKKFNTLSPNGYNLSPTGGTEMGGILSEETKKKIAKTLSKSIKGRKLTDYHKEQLSLAKKGKRFSLEHKKNLSNAAKKRLPSFKGKHHSDESKIKISNASKGRKHSLETIAKFKKRIPWNKGLKLKCNEINKD